MKALYKRLSAEKLPPIFIRKIALPEWWDDAAAEKQSGYSEALAYISQNTGILIDSMIDDSYPLTFQPAKAKFYLGGKSTQNEVTLAAQLATAAARLLAPAIRSEYTNISNDPLVIRQDILAQGYKFVSFPALVDWCWRHGIGVLTMTQFPPRQAKMKAMITYIAKNPVIVLCEKYKYSAWQLFQLAHEIGHLALQHVTPDTEWVDAEIDQEASADDKYSPQENAATRYGVALITGSAEPQLHSQNYLVAEEIVTYAKHQSEKLGIDPGFIALNHGWRNKREGASMSALRQIEPNPAAQTTMQQQMLEHLDTELITEEAIAYLLRIGQD